MNNINSGLMLKNMAFTNVSVERSFDLPNNIDITGSFDINYEEISDDEINVIIKYNAISKKSEIKIEVVLKGNFCIYDVDDQKIKRYLLHVNTIAILIPYLRSQVSLATTQPGFVPIQIPIVNAIALAKGAGFVE